MTISAGSNMQPRERKRTVDFDSALSCPREFSCFAALCSAPWKGMDARHDLMREHVIHTVKSVLAVVDAV